MNPMLTTLSRNQAQPAALEQIAQLRTLASAIKNPGATLQTSVMKQFQNHPLFQQAKQIADRYGGDWNRAFEETARQNGIDPNQIRELMKKQGLVS